ncbi:MAG: CBS domain-containing protein [Caldilineales bacterium]|nr:CBS domain-containing protein [Caldilineales bacterium]
MFTLKNLKVRDAYSRDLVDSLIVQPDEDFAEVVKRFANMPTARGIFVADQHQHLLGVITRRDLLEWSRVRVGAFLHPVTPDIATNFRVVQLMHASTAGDIMHPESRRAGVVVEDSLAYALKTMIELDLIVLPVVDEHGHIIEDLKLDEVLLLITEEDQQS